MEIFHVGKYSTDRNRFNKNIFASLFGGDAGRKKNVFTGAGTIFCSQLVFCFESVGIMKRCYLIKFKAITI